MGLKIGVIGGGAAGFFGAIAAATAAKDGEVVLLEGTHRPLTKVRISGGGRCNVTHNCFDPAVLASHYPRGSKELRAAFARFQAKDTVAWFAERGVALKAEADGRMFPVTNSSQTIIDCLLEAAESAGVGLCQGVLVKAVTYNREDGFIVQTREGALRFDRLLVATGSAPIGHKIAASFGHQIEPAVPSLFTFKIADPRLKDLPGVSFPEAALTLQLPDETLRQTGPLLITHWGLSGPAVLKLSAWGAPALHRHNYQGRLLVNFQAQMSRPQLLSTFESFKSQFPRQQLRRASPLPGVSKRFWQMLVDHCGARPELVWAECSKGLMADLAGQLNAGVYEVSGKGEFKEEFVTCGGVRRKELDFRTMESRMQPGLYFAGEIIDIDGITGGFNFQNAWTTSYLAGQAMAKEKKS